MDSLIYKMLPKIPEQTLIISRLLQSGIIYQDNKEGLKLLSPIQEYLKTNFLEPDTDIKSQICLFYIDEINNNKLRYASPRDKTKFGVYILRILNGYHISFWIMILVKKI